MPISTSTRVDTIQAPSIRSSRNNASLDKLYLVEATVRTTHRRNPSLVILRMKEPSSLVKPWWIQKGDSELYTILQPLQISVESEKDASCTIQESSSLQTRPDLFLNCPLQGVQFKSVKSLIIIYKRKKEMPFMETAKKFPWMASYLTCYTLNTLITVWSCSARVARDWAAVVISSIAASCSPVEVEISSDTAAFSCEISESSSAVETTCLILDEICSKIAATFATWGAMSLMLWTIDTIEW